MTAWTIYGSQQAHKLLSDNRARYLAQSAATVGGILAPLPPRQEKPLCPPPPPK